MNAEFRHIRAFLGVARAGNFTRAAAALNVSQPALTVQIRQLEASLGVRLFDRNNRRVALTQAGQALVAPLERVLTDLESIADHARDLSAHRRGLVTVAALPSIAATVLPRAIRQLNDRHAGIVVRVRDAIAGDILDLVRSGEVDFGVGTLIRPEPDLISAPILTDRLCAVARRDHPIARRRWISLGQLSALPLILMSVGSSVRQLVDRALEERGLAARPAQEATYMTTALGMVRAGLGIAVLPESAIGMDAGTDLRVIALRGPVMTREIGIITRRARSLSPAAERLAEVLQGR
jgi:LysR family carnitine catabolism transcriptional activator